jgi:gas vesicle protein
MSTSYPPVSGSGATPDTLGTNDYLTEVPVIPSPYDDSTLPGGTATGGADQGGAKAKAGAAKDEAADLGKNAAEKGKQVAGTAKDEAGKVLSEVKGQTKQLVNQTRSELADQAGTQQQRVASGLKSLSDELSGMGRGSETQGVAADVVNMAASRVGEIAAWLEARDPGALLDEVRQFAARRPGAFIGAAAIAGLLAGRLTRSIVGVVSDEKEEAEAQAALPTYGATTPSYTSPATGSSFATPATGSLYTDSASGSPFTVNDDGSRL